MKIKLNRAAIQAALKRVVSAVPASNTLEIMSHVVVKVSGSQAVWTGGRMEAQVSVTTPVEADGEGEFTLPAKKFSVLLGGLTGNTEVTLDVGKDGTIMRAGRSRYTLSGLDPSVYPRQSVEPSFTVQLGAPQLAEMLVYVQPCMQTGQDPILFTQAANLVFTGQKLDVVTTDKVRMGYASADIETEPGRILVYRDAVPLVLSVLSAGEVATLGVDDKKFRLVVGDYELIGSQLDAQSFGYERLIQDRQWIALPRAEISGAVNRMIGFSDSNGRCEIDMSKSEIRMRAGERGEADEVVAIDGGHDYSMILALGQIKDALDVSTGDTISVGVGGPGDTVFWRESEAARRFTLMTQLRR